LAQYLSSLWSGRLALASTGVLVLLGLWLIVRMIWLIAAGPDIPSAPVPPVPRGIQNTSTETEFRWQLFGESRSAATPVRPVTTISRSSLRLMGVVSGDNGYAMIADSQGNENVYRSGDELPDGTRLESIESQQVIISANGRDEILALDRDRVAAHDSGSGPRAAPQVSVNPIPGLRGFQAPAGISIASLPDVARTSGLDANALADSISVMPVSSGGFRVRPGRNARLFAELGLQMNDIVTAVNGQPLQSEAAAQALFADVMQRGEVAITINRQGREMTLRPDLEQVIRSLQNP